MVKKIINAFASFILVVVISITTLYFFTGESYSRTMDGFSKVDGRFLPAQIELSGTENNRLKPWQHVVLNVNDSTLEGEFKIGRRDYGYNGRLWLFSSKLRSRDVVLGKVFYSEALDLYKLETPQGVVTYFPLASMEDADYLIDEADRLFKQMNLTDEDMRYLAETYGLSKGNKE